MSFHPESQKGFVDGLKCPYCGSSDVDYTGDTHTEFGVSSTYDVSEGECMSCGKRSESWKRSSRKLSGATRRNKMYGVFIKDKNGKNLIGKVQDLNEARKFVRHMDFLQTEIYELLGRNDYEATYGDVDYSIEVLECEICHKDNIKVKDYGVMDCKGRCSHLKNICSKCMDKIERNATVWEE